MTMGCRRIYPRYVAPLLTELFILFTASAFRKLPSIYVFSYFPFGFEGRIWDLIVSVPDHCLSFYFTENLWCIVSNVSLALLSQLYSDWSKWPFESQALAKKLKI